MILFGLCVLKNVINFAIIVAVLIDTRCSHHPDASASALSLSQPSILITEFIRERTLVFVYMCAVFIV